MDVVITDANIFIDLYEMGLLKGFFKLPYQVNVSLFVLDELDDIKALIEKHVNVIDIKDEDLNIMDSISWPKPFSFPDRTILYLAKTHKMMVLSGERLMMQWCRDNKLEGHGILYVLDTIIEHGIYKPKYVSTKLRLLMGINLWLPMRLCEYRLEKWEV